MFTSKITMQKDIKM